MSRLGDYKNRGRDLENMRSKRKEVTVELRKSKREGQLAKKRNLTGSVDDVDQAMMLDAATGDTTPDTTYLELESLPGFVATLRDATSSPEALLVALKSVRKLLSQEGKPPISYIIKSGIVPILTKFLHPGAGPAIQYEVAWALTNIASGDSEHTMAVVNAGAVPQLVALLGSENEELKHQAVWALGNIAGDGHQTRDLILEAGAMPAILALIHQNMQVTHLQNIMWTICNLCRGKAPPPNFAQVTLCLPYLKMALQCADDDVKVDACWAISYLTDGSNEKIQAVIDYGIVPYLVPMLNMKNVKDTGVAATKRLVPAIRSVGNIVSGNDAQTDTVIQAGGVRLLIMLLNNPNHYIVKEVTWALSNITAGNVNQIQAAISDGLLFPLKNVLEKGEAKCKKEAAWVVTNLTSAANNPYISVLVEMGFVPLMCDLLNCMDVKLILVVLEAIYNILSVGKKHNCLNRYALAVEECGGLDKIEGFQQHPNSQLYVRATDIIDNFFRAVDDDDADEAAASLDMFQFTPYDVSSNAPQFNFD